MAESRNLRNIVLNMLIKTLEEGGLSHVVQKNVFAATDLSDRDKRFVIFLYQGCLQKLYYLDNVINSVSKTKISKMKPVIRNILRLSVYQLLFMDAVPDRAAVAEAVKLCAKRGFDGLKPFVNGVLRQIARQKEEFKKNEASLPLSVRYSMPEWIIQTVTDAYGPQAAQAYLQAADLPDTEVTLRVLHAAQDGQLEKVVGMLEEDGCTIRTVEGLPQALQISGFSSLTGLKAFVEGLVTVQDVSSQLLMQTVGDKELESVKPLILDVCAAPGGKSGSASNRFPAGTVVAMDLSERKAALIANTVQRLKLRNVSIRVHDATAPLEEYKGKADLVICDAPCSGLGVVKGKPDIRYRLKESDISQLATLQRQILTASASYVKPGGILLYSTCTVTPEENIENAKWFAEEQGFAFVSFDEAFPRNLLTEQQKETCKQGYLQLLNGINVTDGFFIAKLKRKNG